ncbi:MAG TPA: conjugative relaxase, partial [Planctomycetaceae bacterium]|nr:conjugative relaxase [Planctomycetaceae bacterium]
KELAAGRLEHAEKTGKNPRIADDLTFSAPKSVSLVAALDDNMREAIVQAHREAVGKVVEFIAHSGMIQARDSRGEPTAAWGAVAVRFDHFLSRNGDPQLHSHVLIANSVFYIEKEFDGRTVQVVEKEGAAYLRDIYTNKTALGALYRHELASRLERLGYEVEWKQDGTFELKGFAAEALKEFSTRRQEIEKHMAEKGVEGGKAAEVAALDTRKPKENLDPAKLRAEWEERAQKAGIEIPRPDPEKPMKIREEDREVDSRDRLVLAEREAEKQVRTAGFSSTLRVSLGLAKELASAGKTSTISEIVGLAEKGTREAGKHFGGLYDLGEDRIGSDVRRWFTFRNNIMAEFRHREIGLRENQKGIDPEKAHQSLQA